jgi:molybdopterin-guanine dinucleotide biosynthesis protein A
MTGTHGGIPAGGEGRRLGLGVPKAMVPLGGMTLLARAIATARQICDTVTVSFPPDRELPEEAWRGVAVAHDPGPGRGPLGGLLAALRGPAWERALVLGVDYPLVLPAALRALLDRLEGRSAVVPAPGGRLQPLVAVYSRAAFQSLAGAFDRGERSVVAAVTAIDPLVIPDDELAGWPGGLEAWLNVNSREDLAAAERRLAARSAEHAA